MVGLTGRGGDLQGMDPETLEELKAGISRLRLKQLARDQLLVDLLGLDIGLRDVIMLDYVGLLRVEELRTVIRVPCQRWSWTCALLSFNSCLYVANLTHLVGRLGSYLRGASDSPLLVTWGQQQHGTPSARVSQLLEVEEVVEGVQHLVSLLGPYLEIQEGAKGPLKGPPDVCPNARNPAGLLSEGGEWEVVHGRGWRSRRPVTAPTSPHGASTRPGPPVVVLDDQKPLPLSPTLNGLLLQYPLVYLVTSQKQAQEAAKHLSTTPLLLHRVTGMVEGTRHTLLSFSVPSALASEELAERVRAMMGHLQAVARQGGQWRDLTLNSVSATHGRVVL